MNTINDPSEEQCLKPKLCASGKQKKCKHCGQLFTPNRPLQSVCSLHCAVQLGKKRLAKSVELNKKKLAKEDRLERTRLKTKAQWMKEAQAAINAYVRARDNHLGCVSCDKPASWGGQWHASHYRSVGAASSVRFNLWNIHKSCSVCNNWKSGNLSEYEPRLRQKIGNEKVDWLRTQTQPRTYSIEYLSRIKKIFTKKLKRKLKELK